MNASSKTLAICSVLCFALLAGVGAHRVRTRTPIEASAYHAKVKAAVDAIPWRVGVWAGEEMPVPPAALALLKPNALLGRSYRDDTGERGITLVVVQCQETRDMAGHYPPICYKANGWKLLEEKQVTEQVGAHKLPITRYLVDRSSVFESERRWVYNILILPINGGVEDMQAVEDAASNRVARQRGAAQIQFVLNGDVPEAEQRQLVREFLVTLEPVVDSIIRFE